RRNPTEGVRWGQDAESIGTAQPEVSGEKTRIRLAGVVQVVPDGAPADHEIALDVPADAARGAKTTVANKAQPFPEARAIQQLQQHGAAWPEQARRLLGEHLEIGDRTETREGRDDPIKARRRQ